MATVTTRQLTKRFNETAAVDGIDLAVKEGEFLVLLGPSGCGKTTLLRMIAGLEFPTSGDVLINETAVTDLPPRSRNMAMVFQSYALYPHLSVYNNIAFPLKAQGVAKAEIPAKVEKAAGMFDIVRLLQRKPRQLSGGERQRVALARAVVREPQVFLLDEPLSNLDAKLRNTARAELQQFQRRIGTTTIYVTHDQVEAMGLGDRIAVFNKGKMVQIGTPVDVYSEPADIFVANFLGSPPMNLVKRGNHILGFRPEHFLPPGVEQGEMVKFGYRIRRVENLGSDRLVYGVLENAGTEDLVMAKLSFTANQTFQEGARYDFVVPRAELRFFDAASGKRIPPQPV
ncbi:MAG TPA: ATP-binding cassette domain-containing protein [bacterium]